MSLAEAQRELRAAFLGGFVRQLVSGAIWALSAAAGAWLSPQAGMAALFFVSMALFPITQAVLRLMGRSTRLSPGNTLGQLATQIAFTVPAGFILVLAVARYNPDWFFPAALVVVGAHYLPFIFLYGMREFALLAVAMIAAGVLIGLYLPGSFSLGGWIGAALLIGFAFAGRAVAQREAPASRASAPAR
jgi:hypothetical protein